MKLKSVLIIFFLVFISVYCSMKTGKIAASKKADGTVYYMDSNKKTLTVVWDEKDERAEKIKKVFYNNKDYTIYIKELIDSNPTIFASDRIIIFSEGVVRVKDGKCSCTGGIVFMPGDTEVFFIESSDILYDLEKNVLTCSHAIMRSKKVDQGNK